MKLPPVFLRLKHTLSNPKPFFEEEKKIQKLNARDDSKKKRGRGVRYIFISDTL